MELRIITPQEAFLQAIEFNGDEIKQELAIRLEKYKGLQYTDEQIKLAKTDRATLNKFKTAIEDKRKEIKNLCLEPYNVFESKIKEITKMVDEPICEIDVQIKGYEESVKNEKKLAIMGIYENSIKNLKEILPFERLFNQKWLNATSSLKSITEEIVAAIEKVEKDLSVIDTLQTEFSLQVKDKFLQTLDLSAALAEKARLEEQAKKIKEYEAEQQSKKEEISQPLVAETPIIQSPIVEAPVIQATFVPIQEEVIEIQQLDFRVWVTPEQKQLLKEFLILNKIRYGKVEN